MLRRRRVVDAVFLMQPNKPYEPNKPKCTAPRMERTIRGAVYVIVCFTDLHYPLLCENVVKRNGCDSMAIRFVSIK